MYLKIYCNAKGSNIYLYSNNNLGDIKMVVMYVIAGAFLVTTFLGVVATIADNVKF